MRNTPREHHVSAEWSRITEERRQTPKRCRRLPEKPYEQTAAEQRLRITERCSSSPSYWNGGRPALSVRASGSLSAVEVAKWLMLVFALRHPQDLTLDTHVRELEDEYENSANLASLSMASNPFPSRPGFGTRGRGGVVWTNYFHLLVHDDRLIFYQYNIDIKPQAVGRKRARIIELLLQQPQFTAMAARICSDFKTTLLSRTLLEDDFAACNIVYQSELELEPGPGAKVYHLRLQHTRTLPVRRFLDSLTATNMPATIDDRDALIQAFNILLNHFAKSQDDLITIGGKTFPKNSTGLSLGRGLLAVQGFFSSVRAATGRLLINVNICCSAFLGPGRLDQFMTTHGVQDMYQLEQMLKGARVKTSYRGALSIRTIVGLASPSDGQGLNQQRPRIQEFGAGPERVHFWFCQIGRYVSVFEFFQRRKSRRLSKTLS